MLFCSSTLFLLVHLLYDDEDKYLDNDSKQVPEGKTSFHEQH